jgi:hypothetical protein
MTFRVARPWSMHGIAAAHGNEGTPVDTGPTPAVEAGERVLAALVTDVSPSAVFLSTWGRNGSYAQ